MNLGKMIILLFLVNFAADAFSMDLLSISSQTKRLEFQSGFSYYDSKNGDVYLSTMVVIRQIDAGDFLTRKIASDEILIHSHYSTVVMKSPFVMEDSSTTIKAEKGYYDYSKNEGLLENGVFNFGRFIISSREIKVKDGLYSYRSASLTTCNLEAPHYHISAHKIYLLPGKYFVAYSTIFYLGRVPIFYFPIVYKPLGDGAVVLSQFYPGYDERNGFYVKSNYTYKFNKYSRAKVFLDYFSKKGVGMGTELDYYRPDRNISSISYYRINEYSREFERWGMNGGIWHSFNLKNGSAYLQTYARLLSDPKFNNDFFRSNPFAITSQKQAEAAFTYNSSKTNTRISYYTEYISSLDNLSFRHAYETAPRLDFNTSQIKIFNFPFWNTWSFYAENAKNDTPYYQNNLYGAWTVSMPVKIYKTFNFYPSIFYYQNVHISTSDAGRDIFIGRYGTNMNARKTNSWGSIDLNFHSIRRNAKNKMRLDKNSSDGGVEKQQLSLSVFKIRNSGSYLRFSSGYDLKDYNFKKDFYKRFLPFAAEIYSYSSRMEIFLYSSYDIASKNDSFISQVNFGGKEEYFGFGLSNYATKKNEWIVSNSFGLVPPLFRKWRIEGVLRFWADFSDNMVKSGFFEKSVAVYKDFHDFRAKFNFRTRKDVKEFFVYITLKMNDPYKNDEFSRQTNAFWRPWRKPIDVRD